MFGGGGAGAGAWNPAGVVGGFGAPRLIASATPRNAISRMIGYAERPSAVVLRSDDASFSGSEVVQPSRFDLIFKQPVLDVKAMALRSATLRNLIPNVPSYQRYFYYTVNNRRFVFRYGQAVGPSGIMVITRELTDFITYLNQSAAYLVEVPAGVLLTDEYYNAYVRDVSNPADSLFPFMLTFAADSTTGRIGASVTPLYEPLTDVVKIGGLDIVPTIFAPSAYVRADLTLDTLCGVPAVPSPPVVFTRGDGAATFLEPAAINGTQSIYVSINVTSSGTMTAANSTRSLLGYFSTNNTPKGNVINYQAPFPHWIWQVAPAMQEVVVQLLDENLQPFDLPFNCLVELELAFLYADSSL